MGGCTYSVQELLLNWNKNETTDDDLVFYEEQGEIHMKTMPKKDNVPIYINSHCGTSEGYQKRKKMTSYSLKKQQNYVKISPLPQSPPAKKQKRIIWCGCCNGCLTKYNCGNCTYCRNKKLGQKCLNRWCKLQFQEKSPSYRSKKESLKYEDSEFQCWICAKTCQSPSGLKIHMRSCGKRYSVEV